jgi:1-acyl-sn-glycerol-3-phosphate acyltransferase/nucleoside-diphosphate-sugar epimerase
MSRWIVAAPDDSVTRRLVDRLSTVAATRRVAPADVASWLGESEAVVYRPRLARGSDTWPDLAEAESFFNACRAAALRSGGLTRLVLLSSSLAIDPSHYNPGFVAEARRQAGRNPIAYAWLVVEALAKARLPGWERIVLRVAPVISRDGSDFFSRLLRRRAAVVPAGYDPPLQLLSPSDLAGAVLCALERGAGLTGIFHVAPAGTVPVRGALRLAGVRRVPLGGALRRSEELDYLRHNWTVSGRRIREELGFVPEKTSAAAILEELGRRGEAESVRAFDDFGQDPSYIAAYGRTLFRFLHDAYWRIEHQGLENVPREGPAVLTGIHRGFMPWDGVMALHLIARELGRMPRFLIHPCLIKFPFLANYMTKLGGIPACQENADWVLGRGEIVGMFPEGIHGAFTMYRDAYRLGKFGRDEYVKMALRHRAPIVPFVTVGSAEIYPILARIDSRLVRRVMEWPFLPLTPTFPLPGLPLPAKWHTRFLEPIPVGEMHPPEAADDPAVVRALSAEVRRRMEEAIQGMLARRQSIFFGSVF